MKLMYSTLLLVLLLKVPSPVISLPSYALSTGSGLLNASNTNSSHLPTKFSQLPKLHTFISSSPLNVLAVLTLHPSLLLFSHLLHPPFIMLNLVSGISSLVSSSTLFWYQLFHFILNYSFIRHFFLF